MGAGAGLWARLPRKFRPGHVGAKLDRQPTTPWAVPGGMVLGLATISLLAARWLAARYLRLPPERRPALSQRPEDYGLACEDVSVVTQDGLALHGWYLQGCNGATIMVQHGSPGGRQDGLLEAVFLNRHGYNVLLGSFRAHDDSDGVKLSFGLHEMKDVEAWYSYLLNRDDVDPARIGIFGESMGGAMGIRFAAEHQEVAAVATASAPAVMEEVVVTNIASDERLPKWSVPILARIFLFWAERDTGVAAADLDTMPFIGQISPRPVLIIHGGEEDRVPPEHGQLLYDAAGDPKEYWFVPEAGHVNFELFEPEAYEERIVRFFDRYLLAGSNEGIG